MTRIFALLREKASKACWLAHVWHSLFSAWWTNTRSDYFLLLVVISGV